MIRKAHVFQVHPQMHAEYESRHQPIWDELIAVLKSHGVLSYSIYLDAPRNLLFCYVEIEDEDRWDAIASTPVCQRWWAFMKDVMLSNADNSPIAHPLKEVYHLD